MSVWHRAIPSGAAAQSEGLLIQTCQRTLTVGGPPADAHDFQHYSGEAAYRLLLEISTGLRSELAGETNVFGQIKRAWQAQRTRLETDLGAWVTRWFADTRRIRRQYLQGIGGYSYASLCRRWLGLPREAAIAIVGGGDLAASMIGLLGRHPLRLFVRGKPRFQPAANVQVFRLSELPAHIADVGAVVACVPADPAWELPLVEPLGRLDIPFVHLGHRNGGASPLAELPGFANLDSLFELKRERDNVRSLQLAAAKRACGRAARRLFAPTATTIEPVACAR